jgi:hypothetical protein
VRLDGVLDGERGETELLRDLVQVVPVGQAEIGPDERVRLLQVVGDALHREVLGLEDSLPPHPRPCQPVYGSSSSV